MEGFEEGGAIPLPHVVVAEDRENGHRLDEVSVRSEEAAVVVALLAGWVDDVTRVQDQIRPQAFQQRGYCQLSLPPAATVAHHREAEA